MPYINGKKVLGVVRTAYLNIDEIKPVKLWENANPNNAFNENSSNPISIPNIYDFDYYVVAFKKYKNASDIEYAKFSTSSHDWCQMMTHWHSNNTMLIVGREVVLVNNTNNIIFAGGTYINEGTTGTSDNYAIPLAIYGTNLL